MTIEAMKQALEALETLTKEMLTLRDELAERGGRPKASVFHQRLWDSSHEAYVDTAIPAAESLRQAIEQAEQPAQHDIPDLIAGALGVSRGTAYDLMREALTEQVQPVARVVNKSVVFRPCDLVGLPPNTPLYTAPPPRQPEPLTDEEILKAISPSVWMHIEGARREFALHDAHAVIAAYEAKNGIKENT